MEVHDDETAEGDALRELAAGEYKLAEKQERLRSYIKAGIPISDFIAELSEDMWLREVLKDLDSTNPFVRTQALRMWGSYQGFLGKKGQKQEPKIDVEFGE